MSKYRAYKHIDRKHMQEKRKILPEWISDGVESVQADPDQAVDGGTAEGDVRRDGRPAGDEANHPASCQDTQQAASPVNN